LILDTRFSVPDARFDLSELGPSEARGQRPQNGGLGVATNCSTWRMEKGLIPDGGKCLFHRQISEYFPPFSGVSHIRQIETSVRHVCKSRKAVFEKRR